MLSLQEIASKGLIKETAADMEKRLDRTNSYFDYHEANIFGTGKQQDPSLRISDAKRKEILETLRRASLREFIAKSSTTGLQGAAYMIPDKIYQIMYDSAIEEDVVAAVSDTVLGPEAIPGAEVKIDIIVDDSQTGWEFSSGGAIPMDEFSTVQATLTPISFGTHIAIGNDLIEDSMFEVMELQIRNAGAECGEKASDLALTVLKTATDGDGTVNSSVTGDANETKFTGGATADVKDAVLANTNDGYYPDTIVLNEGAYLHSIEGTIGVAYHETLESDRFYTRGLPSMMAGMNCIYSGVDTLTNTKVMDDLVTIVFQKAKSLVSGRKRWLRIEKYSDPVRDLVGAVVSCRQDSVTIYNDSIFVLTES